MTYLRLSRLMGKRAGVLLGAVLVAAGASPAIAQSCTGGNITFSGVAGDDTAALQTALQNATNRGVTLTISPGTYQINRVISGNSSGNSTADSGARVTLKKSFNVVATGANFVVGSNMAGDVISIDTNGSSFTTSTCGSTSAVTVNWTGGNFDLRNMRVSTSVPLAEITTDRPSSNQGTADALSFRGTADRSGTRTNKLGNLTVSGLTVTGSNGSWRTAGGDSGLYVSGAARATVQDSTFNGLRDAGVYMSADEGNNSIGGNYLVRRVTVTRSYDGITVKRGADNVTFDRNTITDTVVPLSVKALSSSQFVIGITMTNNTITRCVRCILVENANDARIENNRLFEVGNPVAGDATPVNSRGRQYEGITLEGVRGTNFVRNNQYNSVTGTRANETQTWANVTRKFGSRETLGPSKSGNVYQGSWDRTDTVN